MRGGMVVWGAPRKIDLPWEGVRGMRGGWSGASRWAVGRGLRGTAFELVDEVAQQGEHDVVFAVEELACVVAHRDDGDEAGAPWEDALVAGGAFEVDGWAVGR